MKNIVAAKTNCYKGFTRKETFEGIKKAGYTYVELSATPGSNTGISRFEDFSKLCEIREEIKRLGLVPVSLGGHTNIMDENLIEDFINNIRLASFFGCQYIVTSVGDAHKEDEVISDDATVAEHIRQFLPYLEEYDMKIAIELHGKHATGKILKPILDQVNSNRVFINYDTGNAIYHGGLTFEEMLKDFEDCIDYIGYMHVKDKIGEGKTWNFPALGKGEVPLKEVFEILERHHNECPLCVEIEFTPDGIKKVTEADEALEISLDYLHSLLQ